MPIGMKTDCNQKIMVVEMAIKNWSPFFKNPKLKKK
jgi:hypothetical protein